jgi:uncharacterized protein with HEPN domain
MTLSKRDVQIVEKIIVYCNEIEDMVSRFGKTFESYQADYAYRHACEMCIFQIGELSAHASDDFRDGYSNVPWRAMRSMRNVIAHEYENLNDAQTWATIESDIPKLKAILQEILERNAP